MTREQLKQAKKLTDQIANISDFLNIVDPEKGSDIYSELRIETIKRFKLYGDKRVPLGTFTKEVEIPEELMGDIHKTVSKYLDKLELELKNL